MEGGGAICHIYYDRYIIHKADMAFGQQSYHCTSSVI